MTTSGSISWFAKHEMRLVWRDWIAMMTANQVSRRRAICLILAAVTIALHIFAYFVLKGVFAIGITPDKNTLAILLGTITVSFFMMTSQAVELTTRIFYSRSDLELILSSPTHSPHVFLVRIITIAISTSAMAMMLVAPFINIAATLGGPKWLSAYAVIASASAVATAISVIVTVVLLKSVGPRMTRFIAQVLAAIIGAGLLIAAQLIAIVSHGSISRFELITSTEFLKVLPDTNHLLWLPAWAAMGHVIPALTVSAFAILLLAGVMFLLSSHIADHATATVGMTEHSPRRAKASRPFRASSQSQALRRKEWRLLIRDPWLMSQTLMQMLYLLPPAALLWRNFGENAGTHAIIAPILVMALGQLAGGLSWLAISGEDGRELIGTAPIRARTATIAKIEAILAVIIAFSAPFIMFVLYYSPWNALVLAGGILAASASAIAIQIWHETPATRSHFRRRQTASKIATFSEAFSSIMWAGATGIAIAQSWFCLLFVVLAILVLILAKSMSSNRA